MSQSSSRENEAARIERIIARARSRIRLQYVLDAVTLGIVVGLFAATVVLGFVKGGAIAESNRALALGLCGVFPLAGLLYAMVRRIDDVGVAAMVDRANGFDDRLATALEFVRERDASGGEEGVRSAFKRAQIEDTLSRLDQLDPRKAHRFSAPRDLSAVGLFAAALLLMVVVQFPQEPERERALPWQEDRPEVAEEVEYHTVLDPGLATFRKDQVESLLEKARESEDEEARQAAEELRELLEEDQRGEVTPEQFNERLESIAQKLQDNCDGVDPEKLLSALKVLSPGFGDRGFAENIGLEVKAGKRDAAAKRVDDRASELAAAGELASGVSEEAFFRGVNAAVEQHLMCRQEELEKVEKQLKEAAAAAALDKNAHTKELSEALKQGDMEKAAKAIEEIAKKVEAGDINPKDLEALASLLEKFADKLNLNDPELAKKFQQYKDLVSKLEKKAATQKKGLSDKEKRQLDDAKKQLDQLRKEMEKNDRGEASRRLKRLTEETRKAADELRRQREAGQKGNKQDQSSEDAEKRAGTEGEKEKGENGQQGDKEDGEQQGDKKRNAADELRRLKKDQDGEASKDEIKEATDRLKEDAKRSQGGKKKKGGEQGDEQGAGSQDERANKIDEFLKQAKGQSGEKGQGGEQGQGGEKGQGQQGQGGDKGQGGQNGGDSQGKGGDGYGQGHEDPDGARTADLAGNREDTHVSGQKSGGPSTAETIKKASQQGFASRGYKDVYDNYEKAVEDVLESEKVPPGYRHYVRTYFDFIRPQDGQ